MKRTLIIVDMQQDFMPGGALGVPEADLLVPLINKLMNHFDLIVASKDWHPKDHQSFEMWPPHCIQGTKGAELAKGLETSKIDRVFEKGSEKDSVGYSPIKETDMASYLEGELYVVGVATEYCVLATVCDALDRGFPVSVIVDGCRALKPNAGLKALSAMEAKGGRLIRSSEVA